MMTTTALSSTRSDPRAPGTTVDDGADVEDGEKENHGDNDSTPELLNDACSGEGGVDVEDDEGNGGRSNVVVSSDTDSDYDCDEDTDIQESIIEDGAYRVKDMAVNMVYIVLVKFCLLLDTFSCKIGKGKLYNENKGHYDNLFTRVYGGIGMKHYIMVERSDGVTAFHVETLLHNIFKRYQLLGELFSLHVSYDFCFQVYFIVHYISMRVFYDFVLHHFICFLIARDPVIRK
jgi:hypothetical protein